MVRLESVFVPVHKPVTRASYFRRRCARRRVLLKTDRCVLTLPPRQRVAARHCTPTATAILIGTATATATVIAAHRNIIFKWGSPGEWRGASPRRSRRPPQTSTEAHGFPCRPVRDARSAEWELMSPLSLTRNVREHGFQMHHYPVRATVPT